MKFSEWKAKVVAEIAHEADISEAEAQKGYADIERVMGREFWLQEYEDSAEPADAAKTGINSALWNSK
jgi:hypothetical protein